jgi:hypothetical protein
MVQRRLHTSAVNATVTAAASAAATATETSKAMAVGDYEDGRNLSKCLK